LIPWFVIKSESMKGDAATILPAHVARALLAAFRAVPARGSWPVIDEESWWLQVLHDPRARWPSEKRLSGRYAHLRLDRWRAPVMTLFCRRCGVRKSFDTEQVMKQFGGDYNITLLRHDLVPCPRRHSDAAYGACHLDYER
jgi:hypothetical protein